MWLNLTPAESEAIAELEQLSDRAAAIVGATILESCLAQRLRHELPDLVIKQKSTLHDRMFNNAGPLGSFSSRINIGFMLKLYDEEGWRDLDKIRDIRNDFAHVTAIRSFKDDSVRDRCLQLKACDLYFAETDPMSKGQMMTIDNVAYGKPMKPTIYVLSLASKLKDIKQRYVLSIMYYTLVLRLSSVLLWGEPAKSPQQKP